MQGPDAVWSSTAFGTLFENGVESGNVGFTVPNPLVW